MLTGEDDSAGFLIAGHGCNRRRAFADVFCFVISLKITQLSSAVCGNALYAAFLDKKTKATKVEGDCDRARGRGQAVYSGQQPSGGDCCENPASGFVFVVFPLHVMEVHK